MNTKTIIATVIALLLLLSGIVYKKMNSEEIHEHMNTSDEHSDAGETHEEKKKGPHGGWWFEEGDFSIEVLIFEKGIPPEFRVYAYVDNKLIDTKEVDATITLNRLGKTPETIQFYPEREYLLGDQEVYEPHSFDVLIKAQYQGRSFSWNKQQIEGRLNMDAATLQRTGVELSTAGPVTLQESTNLPGEIRFNQDRFAHIVSPLSGIIITNPKRLGENVEKDELLAVIESRELATLKGDYLVAMERYALANKLFVREKELRDEGISAEQDYLNSEASLAEARINLKQSGYVLSALGINVSSIKNAEGLNRYEIRSPLSGVIINKHVSQGEAVTPENTLFVLADLSEVWVEFTVYPRHLNSVHVGQSVTIQIDTLNQSIPGKVAWIGPLVGDETRSAKAYITLKNPDRILRPGLFVSVRIEDAKANIPVAVKRSAIQTYNDWQVVFVRVGDQFEIKPIELGRQDAEWVEVTQGLDVGAEYVSTNSFLLKAELSKSSASHDH
jgi:cobalt-zinc-cadmium efflux system membrane fusion protein